MKFIRKQLQIGFKPFTSLYLIRHGERADIAPCPDIKKIDLKYDPPLTKLGHQQALTTGKYLRKMIYEEMARKNKSLDNTEIILISSPFLRCLQTSEMICRTLKKPEKIIVNDEIGEIHSSRWF